jgi:hypothetical protein
MPVLLWNVITREHNALESRLVTKDQGPLKRLPPRLHIRDCSPDDREKQHEDLLLWAQLHGHLLLKSLSLDGPLTKRSAGAAKRSV